MVRHRVLLLLGALLVAVVSSPGMLFAQCGAIPARRFDYWFMGWSPNRFGDYSTASHLDWCAYEVDPVALLPQKITQVTTTAAPGNKVILTFEAAWQQSLANCGDRDNRDWTTFATFRNRLAPVLETMRANASRIAAVYLFDEPDASEGGPGNAALQQAVDWLNGELPTIPIFVNWFGAGNNTNLVRVDWHSTTKGGEVSALRGLGKPMHLLWSDFDTRLDGATLNGRWNRLLKYHFSNKQPYIKGLGWCCDVPSDHVGNQTHEAYALLEVVGKAEHLDRQHAYAAFARLSDGKWFTFARRTDGSLYYRRGHACAEGSTCANGYVCGKNDFCEEGDFKNPDSIPTIGGSSPHAPGAWKKQDKIWLLATGADGQIYQAARNPDGTWQGWSPLPGFSQAVSRPVIRGSSPSDVWVGARDTLGRLWVHKLGQSRWANLGPVTALPLLRTRRGEVWAYSFLADGKVHRRVLNDALLSNPQVAWSQVPDEIDEANTVEDFSCTQGDRDWQYQHWSNQQSAWVDMTTCDASFGWIQGQGAGTGFITRDDMAPKDNAGVSRLWRSNFAGDVLITFTAGGAYECGDGVHFKITREGVPLFEATLDAANPGIVDATLETEVAVDTKIRFAVSPIGGNACDTTAFRATIDEI